MLSRTHVSLFLAGLTLSGAAGAWAQDNSGNPWRMAPRNATPVDTAEDERGFTQGYLRGFEQGYRRGAEQASGGAPTANLGVPTATGSTRGVNGVLTDTPPPPLTSAPNPSAALAPGGGRSNPRETGSEARSFKPQPSQWGEYPPLDAVRPANPSATPATRPHAPGSAPAVASQYPYPSPYVAQPGYALPYAQPHAAAPQLQPYGAYGYAPPYGGSPSTLMPGSIGPGYYGPSSYGPSTFATPFGAAPFPVPGLGFPGLGAW